MSARILVKLMSTVKQALQDEMDIADTRYWLDSLTALYWIQNRGEWKQFVKHRVTEILSLSDKSQWGHCPGIDNPADIGSRGATMSDLKKSKLWWEGPEWLVKSLAEWPQLNLAEKPKEAHVEERQAVAMVVSAQVAQDISAVVDIERYSTMRKLLRVTAWVKRFISNVKNRLAGQSLNGSELTSEEIAAAESEGLGQLRTK